MTPNEKGITMPESKEHDATTERLRAHFWITATTLGIHVFLMTRITGTQHNGIAIRFAILTWLLAVFLITEIAGAPNIESPSVKGCETRPILCKFLESVWNIALFYRRVGFTVAEFKCGFFYTFLVTSSMLGVFLVRTGKIQWEWPSYYLGGAIAVSFIAYGLTKMKGDYPQSNS